MDYGEFSSTIKDYYNRVNYTVDKDEYVSISIFKTNPSTMSVAPAYYLKGNKQLMANMNPEGVQSGKVVAKCTASPMEYGKDTASSWGLYYTVAGTLYHTGEKLSSASKYPNTYGNYYPTFCVKKDGTAIIRWFVNPTTLAAALPNCSAMFAGGNPLVYGSKSVFESIVYSKDDSKLKIYDANETDPYKMHFNKGICSPPFSPTNRVFIGHKSDGSYFFVCVDRSTMDMRVGAKLMCALGCDYAINEDGSMATQMRVNSGYSGSYTAGKMTNGGTEYYGACICAYLK